MDDFFIEVKSKNKYTLNDVKISNYIVDNIPEYDLHTNPIINDEDIYPIKNCEYFSLTKKNKRETLIYNSKQLINVYPIILDHIHFLKKHNIVHANIQPKNIEIHKDNQILLANFEHSFLTTVKITAFNKYIPGNYLWPIQVHLLCYVIENEIKSISSFHLNLICKNYMTALDNTKVFEPIILEHYEKNIWSFLSLFENKHYNDLQECIEKLDEYSLNIVYYILLFNDKDKDKSIAKFREKLLTSFPFYSF